jgi:hypothetical protein
MYAAGQGVNRNNRADGRSIVIARVTRDRSGLASS